MYSWVVAILPQLDHQDLADEWVNFVPKTGVPLAYNDTSNSTNNIVAQTDIGVLRCPDDTTVQTGLGNLSYVVNGGFALYHAYPVGWVGVEGGGSTSAVSTWSAAGTTQATVQVTEKLGVMFLQSTYPQGTAGRNPWNVKSTLTDISDGAATTILLSENTLVGVSAGSPAYSMSAPTNWACPLPTFCMFIGATNVCGTPSTTVGLDCTNGGTGTNRLAPSGNTDGPYWEHANEPSTLANINGAQGGLYGQEGSYPFSNSAHPAGCNMGFCDGSVKFVSNTLDGTTYAKLITSAGAKLPQYVRQLPLKQDAFAPQ